MKQAIDVHIESELCNLCFVLCRESNGANNNEKLSSTIPVLHNNEMRLNVAIVVAVQFLVKWELMMMIN